MKCSRAEFRSASGRRALERQCRCPAAGRLRLHRHRHRQQPRHRDERARQYSDPARGIRSPDHRADLPKLKIPSLILQCSDDIIAPTSVGEYMNRMMPRSELVIIDNVGHCPHLSSPGASTDAMESFLAR